MKVEPVVLWRLDHLARVGANKASFGGLIYWWEPTCLWAWFMDMELNQLN